MCNSFEFQILILILYVPNRSLLNLLYVCNLNIKKLQFLIFHDCFCLDESGPVDVQSIYLKFGYDYDYDIFLSVQFLKKRMTGLLFSKGKRVEVSFEKEENCEVWFPAVVEEDTGNDCFLVEYQCLGKNGVPESVKVKVDFLHIRPSPPQIVKKYDRSKN